MKKLLFVLVLFLLTTSQAQAATLSSPSASPASAQAGAHSDFKVSFQVSDLGAIGSGGDDVKSLRLDLPAGLIGNPESVSAKCSATLFAADLCPAASVVGETTVTTDIELSGVLSLPNQAVHGTIYVVPTEGTEAARLGIILRPTLAVLPFPLQKVFLESPVTVRTNGDYGLVSTIENIPNTEPTPFGNASLRMSKMEIILFGSTSDGNAFMTNPTTCGTSTTKIKVGTYSASSVSTEASYESVGCAAVPFAPTLSLASSSMQSDSLTALTATVSLPFDESATAVAGAQPESGKVVLPKGFELSPTIASKELVACTDAEFAVDSSGPSACPSASKIGTVNFVSPLQADPLNGDVFLGQSSGSELNRIFIVASQSNAVDALRIKFIGKVNPDAETGQIVTTFDALPELPFVTFALTFSGGDHAVIATPRDCNANTGFLEFKPFSSNQSVQNSTDITMTDCVAAFAATAKNSVTNTAAGQSTSLTTSLTVPDRSERLSSVKMSLPTGLVGRLAGNPTCSLEQAKSLACPAASLVGSADVVVGHGAKPLTLPGKVFLVSGFDGGIAGLSVETQGIVGPLDLGRSGALGKLTLRSDGGLDAEFGSIPTRLRGVGLAIRELTLRVDKPGFMVNSTSCALQTNSATLVSDRGLSNTSSFDYQATDCGVVPFDPKLKMLISSNTKNSHPEVTVNIDQKDTESAISSTQVVLPGGLAVNLARANEACALTDFDAGKCSDRSIIGSSVAKSPYLETPVSGIVRMVKAPSSSLPQIRVALRGPVSVDLVGVVTIDKSGRIVNTFEGIPNIQLQGFTLKINGGTDGLLTTTDALCNGGGTFGGNAVSHSGKNIALSGNAVFPACPGVVKKAVFSARVSKPNKGKPSMRASVVAPSALSSFSVTLPSNLKANKKFLKKMSVRATSVSGGKAQKIKAKVSLKRNKLTFVVPSKVKANKVYVLMPKGSLTPSKTTRKAKKPRFSVKLSAKPVSGSESSKKLKLVPKSKI